MNTPIQSPVALGRAVREARRRRGWTQTELAESAGVGQPTISNLERGARDASLSTVLRVIALLGVELVMREVRPPDARASEAPEARTNGDV